MTTTDIIVMLLVIANFLHDVILHQQRKVIKKLEQQIESLKKTDSDLIRNQLRMFFKS